MAKKFYGDSSGKGHSCNYLRSNARVDFDPGLYGKRMSKSDLYHLKPLLILHKGGSSRQLFLRVISVKFFFSHLDKHRESTYKC